MDKIISMIIEFMKKNQNHEYFKIEFNEIEWFNIMEENKIKITDDEFKLGLKEEIKSKFGFDVGILFKIYDVKRIINIFKVQKG